MEHGSAYSTYNDEVLALYHFNISSANTQPTDKGEHRNTNNLHTNTCEAHLMACCFGSVFSTVNLQDQHC